MNKTRRKELAALRERLNHAENLLGEVQTEVECIRDECEDIKEQEQEALDVLPESIQNGKRGAGMQEAIGELENAIEGMTGFADGDDEANFDEWRGNLEQAEAY